MLSFELTIGILNIECAVRATSKNDAATAEVATAITVRLLCCSVARIAAMVNVFLVLPGSSRKYAQDL